MTTMIPVIIVVGIIVVLVICWLMIALKPDKWVPPTPTKGPASRAEVQRRAQKSVDDAKNLASQDTSKSRDVISDPNHYQRVA